jgi:hypothetical protein
LHEQLKDFPLEFAVAHGLARQMRKVDRARFGWPRRFAARHGESWRDGDAHGHSDLG